MGHSPFSTRQQQTGLTEEKYLLYKVHPAKPITTQPKKSQCPRASNVKTDETGFGGFVTMPLGIFAKSFGTNLAIAQPHFRIPTKQHPGEIAMYRYLLCLILI
jgi:hypothetical protein